MGFDKIFWGTVFLFTFRINGIDILPDFIGYILLFLGLQQIEHIHIHFKRAKNIAFVLIFPSIFTVYEKNSNFINSMSIKSPFTFIIGTIVTVLFLCYMYFMFRGIIQKAIELNDQELENGANLVWIIYLMFNIGLFISIPIPPLGILLFILNIFGFIYQLLILSKAKVIEEHFS